MRGALRSGRSARRSLCYDDRDRALAVDDFPAMIAMLVQPSFPAPLRSIALAALFAASSLACAAAPPIDFNRANDYYPARGSNQLKVVELYHLGPCEQRLRARDYQRTYNECDFILKIFPNHPQALVLALEACERWNSPLCNADDLLDRAVSVNPAAPLTFVIEGMHQHRIHQYGRAIQSYQHALELDPSLMNAHYNLALTYVETRQFDLANEHAQQAYALGATLPGLRHMLQEAGHWSPEAKPGAQGAASAPPGAQQGTTPAAIAK